MTRILLATFLAGAALVLAGPLQAQSAARWQSYHSAEGRFKVAFPGEPVTKRGKFRTATGDIPSTQHTAGDGAEATYDVRYSDYPGKIMAKLTPAKLLDAARDGLVAQSKGKLASEKPFSMGKVAGREQEIVGEDGTRYRIRLLLVENRLYQLTAMARPPARADEDRFFGSFQLIGFSKP
jgi:hypothetical protein